MPNLRGSVSFTLQVGQGAVAPLNISFNTAFLAKTAILDQVARHSSHPNGRTNAPSAGALTDSPKVENALQC